MKRLPPSFSALVVGGAVGVASLLQGGTAEAGHAHFSGGGHFGGSAHFSGGGRYSVGVRMGAGFRGGVSVHVGGRGGFRPWRPGRPWAGGSVWVGGYYYPRPYYYYYYPEYVPSYYAYPQAYYPVQPAVEAGPGAVAVRRPRQPLPRLGIGVSAGGVFQDGSFDRDKQTSSDLSVLGRVRLTDGLLIEGEFGKTAFKDNERVDRRVGGSLIWEIGAHNALAPYLLVGGGVNQADVDGNFSTTQDFGEVGIGLRLALTRNLHIAADIRAGRRKSIDSNQPDVVPVAARTVAPPTGSSTGSDTTEDYSRARLAAILMF
jgi:hypothetical protein